MDQYWRVAGNPGYDASIAIDTATPCLAWIADELAARDWTLKLIVSTHGHWDHIGDNAAVAEHSGADIAVHPLDRERLTDPQPLSAPFEIVPSIPAVELAEGGEIRFGEIRLAVLHTPGHTEGSVCLLGRDDGRGTGRGRPGTGAGMKPRPGRLRDAGRPSGHEDRGSARPQAAPSSPVVANLQSVSASRSAMSGRALSTWCGTPAACSLWLSFSDFSTERVPTSTATVTRVALWLRHGTGGYRIALDRAHARKRRG